MIAHFADPEPGPGRGELCQSCLERFESGAKALGRRVPARQLLDVPGVCWPCAEAQREQSLDDAP